MNYARPDWSLLRLKPTSLPDHLWVRTLPTQVSKPSMAVANHRLAAILGIASDDLESTEALELLSGNRVPRSGTPVATAYAGHQFGKFAPRLGDGRAVLLGEISDRDGHIFELLLKGSGRTPFSRGGDGRAPLGAVLKEYIMSEAMAAFGVPTTRSLAVVTTGETIDRGQPTPSAILTRIAASHIRIGTFEYLAARGDIPRLRGLADHVIERFYPACEEERFPYRALLEAIADRQAELVASWMGLGFVHGVLNTDNIAISGETVDYGPCAFLDQYDPDAVFSEIDVNGRYAYAKQPAIMRWNIARLAEAFLPLLAPDQATAIAIAQAIVDQFSHRYEKAFRKLMLAKIGIETAQPSDQVLVDRLLELMASNQADFTLTFHALTKALSGNLPLPLSTLGVEMQIWMEAWRQRLELDDRDETAHRNLMLKHNPSIIPRTHHLDQAISAWVDEGDCAPFHELAKATAEPFAANPKYSAPPLPHERITVTQCGT